MLLLLRSNRTSQAGSHPIYVELVGFAEIERCWLACLTWRDIAVKISVLPGHNRDCYSAAETFTDGLDLGR